MTEPLSNDADRAYQFGLFSQEVWHFAKFIRNSRFAGDEVASTEEQNLLARYAEVHELREKAKKLFPHRRVKEVYAMLHAIKRFLHEAKEETEIASIEPGEAILSIIANAYALCRKLAGVRLDLLAARLHATCSAKMMKLPQEQRQAVTRLDKIHRLLDERLPQGKSSSGRDAEFDEAALLAHKLLSSDNLSWKQINEICLNKLGASKMPSAGRGGSVAFSNHVRRRWRVLGISNPKKDSK